MNPPALKKYITYTHRGEKSENNLRHFHAIKKIYKSYKLITVKEQT